MNRYPKKRHKWIVGPRVLVPSMGMDPRSVWVTAKCSRCGVQRGERPGVAGQERKAPVVYKGKCNQHWNAFMPSCDQDEGTR